MAKFHGDRSMELKDFALKKLLVPGEKNQAYDKMNIRHATEYKNTSHLMCVLYYFIIFSSFVYLQKRKKYGPGGWGP